MKHYMAKRVLFLLPTLILTLSASFFLTQLLPGGPLEAQLREWRDNSPSFQLSAEQMGQMRAQFGYEKDWGDRYWGWLSQTAQGELGQSFYYRKPVTEVLAAYFPNTFYLGVLSLFLTLSLVFILGTLKSLFPKSYFDRATTVLLFALYTVPPIALALGLLKYFGFASLVGPVLCFSVPAIASLTLFTRNKITEEFKEPFIRTAHAKGLSNLRVVFRHAIWGPIVSLTANAGFWLAFFFSGSLIVETVFSIPGLGKLAFDSLERRDYPVMLGLVLITSVLYLLGNFFAEIIASRIDRRIRYA